MESIELKRLKTDIQRGVDEALNEHVLNAEKWAGHVRLCFTVIFAAAAAAAWQHPDTRKYIYASLAAAWLAAFILVRLRLRQGTSDSLVTLTTLVDFTIVNSGLFLFVWQRPGITSGQGLFLCYFPLLAIAAMRYRMGLVLSSGLYAAGFYTVASLTAIGSPWFRIAMLLLTTLIGALGSRRPKDLMVGVADRALEDGFTLGGKQREVELKTLFHEAVFPPAILDLPTIWSSSKHAAGTETGGDYYQVFETEKGPLVALADLGGQGADDVRDVARVHQALLRIVLEDSTLSGILARFNGYLFQTYGGQRKATCFLARWEGDEMEYASAAHLPAIHFGKNARQRLEATCGSLGEKGDAVFASVKTPFPARDILLVFTDGLYRKLADNREQGIAEIEGLAERFSHGEVNTICHRVFDCAQPGLEESKDDCTLVVVRRQPKAAEESKAKTGAEA